MKIKQFLLAMGSGAGALVIGTLIYAAVESRVIEIDNPQTFETFIQKNPQVLVEFFNPTCPVCNAFKKKGIFEHSAGQLPEVQFVMVSSETGQTLHRKYNIQQFPTFVYFKDGKPIMGKNEQGQADFRHPGYLDEPSFTNRARTIFEQ